MTNTEKARISEARGFLARIVETADASEGTAAEAVASMRADAAEADAKLSLACPTCDPTEPPE